jgi:hypothetical protein
VHLVRFCLISGFRAVEHMRLLEDLHESKMADGLLLDVRSPPLSALIVLYDVNIKP